jgi:hypothetical protein
VPIPEDLPGGKKVCGLTDRSGWSVAAVLMALHPALRQAPSQGWSAFFADAAVVAVLALTAGWQVAFLPPYERERVSRAPGKRK